MTRGRRAATDWTAVTLFPAWPTTRKSGSAVTSSTSPSRNRVWSPATRMSIDDTSNSHGYAFSGANDPVVAAGLYYLPLVDRAAARHMPDFVDSADIRG